MTELPAFMAGNESSLPQQQESGAVAAMSRERYEIEGAMILARRFPREEDVCRKRIMQAVSRPSFAEDCLYAFPRGNTTVEGPSVKMAREMCRVWGNLRSGIRVLSMDQRAQEIHVQGFAYDVQTNAYKTQEAKARTRIYRRGKGWIELLKDDMGGDTERQLAELVGRVGAKLERNCMLHLLPFDLIDEAIERVKVTQAQGRVDPDKLRSVVSYFASKGVNTAKIERYLGCRMKDLSGEHLAQLRRIAKSVQDGESVLDEYFTEDAPAAEPPKKAKVTVEPAPQKRKSAAKEPDPEDEPEEMLGDFEQSQESTEDDGVEYENDAEDDSVSESDALGDVPREPKVWTNKQRAPKNAEPGDIWQKEGSDDAPMVLDVDGEWKVAADVTKASEAILRQLAQSENAEASEDESESESDALPKIVLSRDVPDPELPGAWWIRETDGRCARSDGETWLPDDESQLVNALANRVAEIARERGMKKDDLLPIIKKATGREPKGLLSMSAKDLFLSKRALEVQ